jgi:hypothetical protein
MYVANRHERKKYMENLNYFEKLVIKGALEKKAKSLQSLLDSNSCDGLKDKEIIESNFKYEINTINELIKKLKMEVR